ncbi:hypothetical protein HY310_01990 [Candidatus Microgenomates bacterium]|nr:hypothetical protein [Candidatus Microgenomates bacterium]
MSVLKIVLRGTANTNAVLEHSDGRRTMITDYPADFTGTIFTTRFEGSLYPWGKDADHMHRLDALVIGQTCGDCGMRVEEDIFPYHLPVSGHIGFERLAR